MLEAAIRKEIEGFVRDSHENRFLEDGGPFFAEPLVGFAAADDPLFREYKNIIGAFHQTPQDVMAKAFGNDVRAQTVIVWVLPVVRTTSESNGREERFPSREWAVTRALGEKFNSALRRHVTSYLEGLGHRTVAPQLASGWRQLDDETIGLASTWSERHAAYAAGLGTFSLNDGFITPKGISHRLGSVVTTLSLAPTRRIAPDHLHNCLYYREGTCGACIGRCPIGAISRSGHDKGKCRGYVYGTVPEAVGSCYGVKETGCGLCQTRVPCEGMVPPGKKQHGH
ncbi:hypothetical protein SAMN06269301_2572 [Geobacter sp. DSM 9736]|nr:hypothetical protein SAMN06269301_2572 [Geobacter sp. DSM 9736]